MNPRSSIWIVTSLLAGFGILAQAEVVILCERNDEHFTFNKNLACDDTSHVIHILNAIWGRSDTTGTVCPANSGNHEVQCPGDLSTLNTVRALCQDQHSCILKPTVQDLGEPCDGEYKYLEVEYQCAAPDELAHLPCRCSVAVDGGMETFDGTSPLAILGNQKTLTSLAWVGEFHPCKNKLRTITNGGVVKDVYFSVGQHPNKASRYNRDFMIDHAATGLRMRGIGVSGSVLVPLPYTFISDDGATVVELMLEDDVIKIRSPTCPYALDVDVTSVGISFTLYAEPGPLSAMCGNCDGIDNEYRLRDGTDVSAEEDKLQLISDSYAL